MKLYLFKYSDYRTGTKLELLDKHNLLDRYNSAAPLNSESSDLESPVKKTDIEKAINKAMEDDNIADIIEMKTQYKSDKYLIYLITGTEIEYYNTKYIIDVDTEELSGKMLRQLYSYINGCQRFVTTDLTSSYKEEGYYPEPLPEHEINNVKLIDMVREQLNEYPSYCIAVSIYNNKLYDYLQILPIF